MWTRKFWLDAIERTIKTFAQTLGAILTLDGVVDRIRLEWVDYLLGSGIAALAAFLMAIAGSQIGSERTASWLPAGPDTDRGHSTWQVVAIAAVTAIVTIALMKVFGLIP